MQKVEIPAAPGRLIHAVASIGYDPEVALCDLVDNCIDAGATTVSIAITPIAQEEGDADRLQSYAIADDGAGMDEEMLKKAFTLGTERKYPKGALGKFGIGLKSAGLSLAGELVLVTKTEKMADPLCAVLRLSEVEASGKYQIDMGKVPDDLVDTWLQLAPNSKRGTLLLLRALHENQPPYARFTEYLRRYCAITYHQFLENPDHKLKHFKVNDVAIEPRDPLALAEATKNGPMQIPEDWDGKTVQLLLGAQELPLDEHTTCTIAATHLVHPPSFELEGRRAEVREQYMIDSDPYTLRPRHGFYVYRNGRVIVMAERFRGVIASSTQAMAFRGKLEFTEAADSILSLDVKKRHCQLPKDARNNLKALISTYQAKSTRAWETVGRKVQKQKGESKETVANESIAQAPVGELTYAPGADLSTEAAVVHRQEKQTEIAKDTLASVQDPQVSREKLDEQAKANTFVIPVQGLKSNAMWLPYPSIELGKAETLINKHHSWIAEVLAEAEDDPRILAIVYQMFTILARADIEVRSTNYKDLPDGATDKVLARFRTKAGAIGEDLVDALIAQLRFLVEKNSASEE